jgi:host factor-I protein
MASSKTKAPEQTFEESKYLKRLVETAATVQIKLSNDEEIVGVIEFYDESFLRVTRAGEPNLFIYKHDIKYLYERAQ